MDKIVQLRETVATMLMLSPDVLQADTSLRSLDNSISGTRLRLGLKRIGIEPSFKTIPATFGQLERTLGGDVARREPINPAAELPRSSSPITAGSRIGHDIEDIGSLPDAADYWSHEFYLGSFSRAELAYAVVLSKPKEHFAGFWAAKEALKKCDPSLADLDLPRLTVAHNADGSPYFFLDDASGGVRLMHALSISHAENTASAVVLSPATANT